MELKSKQELPTQSPVTPLIAEAWGFLRQNRAADAASIFEQLIQKDGEDVDAYYGQGLALRALDKKDAAIESFQKALDVAQKLLAEIRSHYGSDETRSSLDTTDDDRYMMMDRMIHQRLAELGVATE
jgi:tetratricopeptide (TPR) repeat protein